MHHNFDGCKSYVTYANAKKKLDDTLRNVGEDVRPHTMIAVTSSGRFVPVAIGERAVKLGLFHAGIVVVG